MLSASAATSTCEKRGFDITGHHYWYRHSWASSDIIFLLRTDLPAHQRGLEPSDLERVRQAAEKSWKASGEFGK